jgi:hypothetical protein
MDEVTSVKTPNLIVNVLGQVCVMFALQAHAAHGQPGPVQQACAGNKGLVSTLTVLLLSL